MFIKFLPSTPLVCSAWKKLKTQQSPVILYLCWKKKNFSRQENHAIVLTSLFSKSSIFKKCFLCTFKIQRWNFQNPLVWTLFLKSFIIMMDKITWLRTCIIKCLMTSPKLKRNSESFLPKTLNVPWGKLLQFNLTREVLITKFDDACWSMTFISPEES